MMDPALHLELGHECVDERKAGPCIFPGINHCLVAPPWDLFALWVADHLVMVGRGHATQVEEFLPQKLTMQAHWRLCVLWILLVAFVDLVV